MRQAFILTVALTFLLIHGAGISLAQASAWSSPRQISTTGEFAWFPDIAADPFGHVHIVWASFLPGYDYASKNIDSVIYASADRSGIWSRPTDIIILGDGGAATRPTITFDTQGNAHIVARDGEVMRYFHVPFNGLTSPRLWPPGKIVNSFGPAYFSQVVAGQDGRLHLVTTDYLHAEECKPCLSVLYRQSLNGGETWTRPTLISSLGLGAAKPKMIVSSHGDLHLVWESGMGGDLGRVTGNVQVDYAASRDGGQTWSEPIELSGPNAGFVGSGRHITIAEDGLGKLITVWLKLPEDVPHYQISNDRGLTWSSPTPLPGVFGTYAVLDSRWDTYSMVVDSAGNAHLVMIGRLDKAERALSVLHLVWDGASWSSPTVIATYQEDTPVWPRIAVGLGNQLHVTWFTASGIFATDQAGTELRVWYSRGTALAPSIPPAPYPDPAPGPTPLPTATRSASQVLPTPPPVNPTPAGITFDALKTEVDDYGLIALSVAPIVLLFVIGLLITRRRG